MNYFGKIIYNISQAYSEINPATLTGAIDVIVVEQEDGTYLTSPFHVRFGKMGVLRSKEKIVDIEINGVPVDIHMKLGDGGEAYFVEELNDDTSEDEKLLDNQSPDSSPGILNSPEQDSTARFTPDEPSKSDDENEHSHSVIKTATESVNLTPSSQKRTRRKKKGKQQSLIKQQSTIDTNNLSIDIQNAEEILKSAYSESDLQYPYSDSETSKKPKESIGCHISDYKSDSEIEISKIEKTQNNQDAISWDWGELPNVKKESVVDKEARSVLGGVLNFISKDKDRFDEDKGIYLDELDPNEPEVAAKYFPKFRPSLTSRPNVHNATSSDEDIESGNGPSLSNSPRSGDFNYMNSEMMEQVKEQVSKIPGDLLSLSRLYHDMSMSLCGRVEDLIANPDNSERYLQSIISFDDFSENPLQILENPNLVIRMGANYYPWKMAQAMILSLLMFQRPLSEKTMHLLKEKCIPKKVNSQNSRSWRSWWRSPTSPEPNSQPSDDNQNHSKPSEVKSVVSNNGESFEDTDNYHQAKYDDSYSNRNSIEYVSDEETYNSVVISNSGRNSKGDISISKKMKYKKVLRLSSDVLKSLNLKNGSNDVRFSVTTAYQGTTECKSRIFLWRYDDKIIISDIDGTITKSDVLGHILPYIGKDWAQFGVTQLFSKIEQNGYKFLYLSARAIGQAKGTREYLTGICQEGQWLPDGPLLLSPTSLFSALHREVIEKKPEEFKISCLKDIQSLFPTNPFFAGFGNKINDTWAYKAVGIDPSRIFTINHRGELKLDKIMSFKSSYIELSQICDQMFPPLNKEKIIESPTDDFSSFMYWRTDIPDIPELDLIVSK